jgi:phosphoribosylglycinamide formyltransferase-1
MKNIVFLISGGGSNLKFVQYSIRFLNLHCRISGVIADRDIRFKDFLKYEGVEFVIVKYNKEKTLELKSELRRFSPDLIVTNIHKIIDSETLNEFEGKFINLHYSLLPAFSGVIGMKTVEEARKQNVQFIGGTCHEVIEMVDAGKILYQGAFTVKDWKSDSLESIIDTVFKLSCLLLLSGITFKLNLGNGAVESAFINEKIIYFSPSLPFVDIDFSFDIFNKLK